MDFRTREQKGTPPAGLPKNDEIYRRSGVVETLPPEEGEIRLPKFVKPPEEKEGKKYKPEVILPSSAKKDRWLILIVILILVVICGVYLIWKKGFSNIFAKKKQETKVEKMEVGFENQDDDGDGLSNLQEMQNGTNSKEKDTDFDGIPDGWEVKFKLNPLDYVDALSDPDEDKLTNLEEYQYSTDPTKKDSDGDGYGDGSEVEHGYNPVGPGKFLPKS